MSRPNIYDFWVGHQKKLRYAAPMQESSTKTMICAGMLPAFATACFMSLALMTGCATAQKTERREAVYAAAEQRTKMKRMSIPIEAVQLLDPYTHPEYTARQAFSWNPVGTE